MPSRNQTILNLRSWIREARAACNTKARGVKVAIDANTFHNLLTSVSLLLDDLEVKEDSILEITASLDRVHGQLDALKEKLGIQDAEDADTSGTTEAATGSADGNA